MCRHFLTIPALLAIPVVARAQEAPRVSLDVAATGGYSNNPFSQVNGSTGTGSVSVDVTPQIELVREHSTFTASATAHVDQYFSRYPTTDSYRGSLGYRGRPSATLSTFARVDLSSAILGSYADFASGSGSFIDGGTTGTGGTGGTTGTGSTAGGTPDTGIGTVDTGGVINDIGLFGTRERRRSLYATGGLSAALSARDSVSASAFGDFARYRNFATSNYNGFGGSLAYSRQLSAFTSLGVQGSASRYEYSGLRGDTNVYSVQATGSTRLSQHWSAQGALGVSFVNDTAPGSTNRTSLSGNLSLCREGEASHMCLTASRAARATGFNGSQYVTSAGLDWRLRLSERAGLGLAASYVKEGGLRTLTNVQNQYLTVSPSYSRQILERLRLIASLRYRQIFGDGFGRSADYGGQLGVSYHFGRFR